MSSRNFLFGYMLNFLQLYQIGIRCLAATFSTLSFGALNYIKLELDV